MSSETQTANPNVLFIAIDDLNSCPDQMAGDTPVHTPNINRLAGRGVYFTNAHCAAPACNPSRASVMTGLAPSTSGVYLNNQDWRECSNLEGRTTLPQHFKDHGYRVVGGGKIYHGATLSPKLYTGLIDPEPWDEYFPSKQCQMPPEVRPPGDFPVNGCPDFYRGWFDWAPLDIEPEEMADAKVVAWAEKQMAGKHDRPLFLGVGIYRPHIPWYTPRCYYDMHPPDQIELPEVPANALDGVPEPGRKMAKPHWHRWIVENGKWREAVQAYCASVSFVDDMIGRLLDALDNSPLADNTVVVLWSDHGYHLGQKEHWEKFSLWEQTTRAPLVVAAPGTELSRGTPCREAVSLLDIYPTLVELCGIASDHAFDGESLAPLLRSPQTATGRAVVSTQKYRNHAVCSDRYHYIRYADGSEELYDHETDPKEFRNLAQQDGYGPVKRELAAWLPKHDADLDPEKRYKQA